MSVHRDLLRIPVEFSNQVPGGPSACAGRHPPVRRVRGSPSQFDAPRSRDADGSIANYEWDLDGDGNYSGTPTRIRSRRRPIVDPDTVTVTVRVSDNEGKATDETTVVRVTGPALGASGANGHRRPDRHRRPRFISRYGGGGPSLPAGGEAACAPGRQRGATRLRTGGGPPGRARSAAPRGERDRGWAADALAAGEAVDSRPGDPRPAGQGPGQREGDLHTGGRLEHSPQTQAIVFRKRR